MQVKCDASHIESGMLLANRLTNDTTTYACSEEGEFNIDECAFRAGNCSFNNLINKELRHDIIEYSNFKDLELVGNNITEVSEYVFIALPNLIEVNMKHNLLKSLPRNLFRYNKELETLYLNHNQLHRFSVNISHLHKLTYLTLDNNPLTILDEDIFKPFFIYFSRDQRGLDVSLNHINCSCNMKWLLNIQKQVTMGLYVKYNTIRECPHDKGCFYTKYKKIVDDCEIEQHCNTS